jgi:hypothetical protein
MFLLSPQTAIPAIAPLLPAFISQSHVVKMNYTFLKKSNLGIRIHHSPVFMVSMLIYIKKAVIGFTRSVTTISLYQNQII